MARWSEFEAAEPSLAAQVRAAFSARRHHVMATLRRDGAPRISGTEVALSADGIEVAMMRGTRRASDLRRRRVRVRVRRG